MAENSGNGLPDEGRSPKSGHRMAAEGIPFPWRGNGSTISTDLDVIWGMSVDSLTYTQETFLDLIFKNLKVLEVPVKVRGTREFGSSRVASSMARRVRSRVTPRPRRQQCFDCQTRSMNQKNPLCYIKSPMSSLPIGPHATLDRAINDGNEKKPDCETPMP